MNDDYYVYQLQSLQNIDIFFLRIFNFRKLEKGKLLFSILMAIGFSNIITIIFLVNFRRNYCSRSRCANFSRMQGVGIT